MRDVFTGNEIPAFPLHDVTVPTVISIVQISAESRVPNFVVVDMLIAIPCKKVAPGAVPNGVVLRILHGSERAGGKGVGFFARPVTGIVVGIRYRTCSAGGYPRASADRDRHIYTGIG